MTVDPRTVIRDKVADSISHFLWIHPYGSDLPYPFQEYVNRLKSHIADAAIAAHLEALEQAERIESPEDLDALPDGSIYASDGHHETPEVKWNGHWYAMTSDAFEPDLPGAVLWRPEETPNA